MRGSEIRVKRICVNQGLGVLCNIYFFKQLSLPCLAVSVLYFKKDRDRLREYSKIRNFVTYQLTFLLTCQPQKTPKSPFKNDWPLLQTTMSCMSRHEKNIPRCSHGDPQGHLITLHYVALKQDQRKFSCTHSAYCINLADDFW